MAAIFAFTCKSCGKVHEGSPSFGYDAPWHYSRLTDEEKTSIAKLGSDTCVIQYADRTDRFIRTVLEVPIHGVEEPFLWGVWVSLSEGSFNRYVETYSAPDETDRYFGWFCNRLPFYPDTIALGTDVHPRKDGSRPYLRLHRGKQAGHPLVVDLYEGISVAGAQEIAECAAHHGEQIQNAGEVDEV